MLFLYFYYFFFFFFAYVHVMLVYCNTTQGGIIQNQLRIWMKMFKELCV